MQYLIFIVTNLNVLEPPPLDSTVFALSVNPGPYGLKLITSFCNLAWKQK